MKKIAIPQRFNRLYSNFAGVDFSSDHTLVRNNRLAYSVNMYKDYRSSQGQAIETFAGFEKVIDLPLEGGEPPCVYQIFAFNDSILIHAGTRLYKWDNYPYSANIAKGGFAAVEEATSQIELPTSATKILEIKVDGVELDAMITVEGELENNYSINESDSTKIDFYSPQEGNIEVLYYENEILAEDSLYDDMNLRASSSFIFNNKCYIIDGKNYLVYDGTTVSKVTDTAYVPTTYINRIPGKVEIKSTGKQLEQRNKLSPYFKNTFIAPTPETFTLSVEIDNFTCEGITGTSSTITQAPTETLKQECTLGISGTITTEGKAQVDVYSYLFVDEVEYLYVELENGDTASEIAEKVGNELKENGIVSIYYDVAVSTSNIVLTAKSLAEIVKTYHLSENEIDSVEEVKVYGEEMEEGEVEHKETFAGDGTTTIFNLSRQTNISDIVIEVGGDAETGFSHESGVITFDTAPADGATISIEYNTNDYSLNEDTGVITFTTAPTRPQDNDYAVDYAGVEIKVKKQLYITGTTKVSDYIEKSTIVATYDNRVFFSGNPSYGNEIYHSMLNDPSYIGELCFMVDGKGQSPIMGIMTVAESLVALKADTQQDSNIYYHNGVDTGDNINPRIYPSESGLSGIGCISACRNFLDDPVFISRLGLKAIGQRKVTLERAIEHRSSMVDGRFTNEDLEDCLLEEWNGYLICMVNGKFYMADSRQVYISPTGNKEYEWYYIEGVGIYDNQYTRYDYATEMPEYLADVEIEGKPLQLAITELLDRPANYALETNGEAAIEITQDVVTYEGNSYTFYYATYVVDGESQYYLVEDKQEYIGGVFYKATTIKEYKQNLLFGTGNGYLCKFNFEKRVDGIMPSASYSFDNRAIICGIATVFDNCNYPNMLKTTAKKTLVVKGKTLPKSALKIKVRTNKDGFRLIGEINNGYFSFRDVDFADLTFNTNEQQVFVVNEREKKWVEKQFFIYSDKIFSPFALYYIVYQFSVIGNVK